MRYPSRVAVEMRRQIDLDASHPTWDEQASNLKQMILGNR